MNLDDAELLGEQLLTRHGLDDWTVVFDNARTRYGLCRPSSRHIALSRHLTVLSSTQQVRNTLLHEIAHALVGAEHGHDEVWRARALAIGCDGRRSDRAPRGAEGSWEGTCPAGHVVRRHRRPRRVGSCRLCSTTFDPRAIYTWTHGGQEAEMLASYTSELSRIERGNALRR